MSDTVTMTETEAAAALAQEGEELEPGTIYALPDGPGRFKITDTDALAATPRFRTAHRRVATAESFVAYVNRHVQDGTEVWAHAASSTLVGILDAHSATVEGGDGAAGWEKHKVSLILEQTPAWQAWVEQDGKWLDQHAFAEFVEERALDVRKPDHATLADIATSFEATTSASFGSAVRLQSGAIKFGYEETISSRAGQKGDIEIPQKLEIAVRPYVGGPVYALSAAFRYRLGGASGLKLGYRLERPEAVLEAAFADIVQILQDGTEATETRAAQVALDSRVPVFNGRPS